MEPVRGLSGHAHVSQCLITVYAIQLWSKSNSHNMIDTNTGWNTCTTNISNDLMYVCKVWQSPWWLVTLTRTQLTSLLLRQKETQLCGLKQSNAKRRSRVSHILHINILWWQWDSAARTRIPRQEHEFRGSAWNSTVRWKLWALMVTDRAYQWYHNWRLPIIMAFRHMMVCLTQTMY